MKKKNNKPIMTLEYFKYLKLILGIWKCNVNPRSDQKGMHTAPYTPR